MRMLIIAASIITGLSLPIPTQALDLNASADLTRCQHALDTFERAVNNYMAAKFALDRATQLLASARYASRVMKLEIDLASREADAKAALSPYIVSIGPAYGAVELMNASCSADAVKQVHQRLPPAQFKRKMDANIAELLRSGVDKLADDQMADIKKMFDDMKARQK